MNIHILFLNLKKMMLMLMVLMDAILKNHNTWIFFYKIHMNNVPFRYFIIKHS
jgi:hypothetical protein